MITGMVSAEKTVTVIPTKPEYSGKNRIDLRPKRVAAYCRVSTDREEQEHSFEAQKQKYTDMIMMKPNWQMAGIYADEGITGTTAKKRPGFMKMIEDCRKGKIDVIITKSVSRFSRNNLDCIMYVRELKERGIPVIFEKEGLNTLSVSSELLLALFGGLSQAESESISMNVKMGIRQGLKKGNVSFCYKSFLGYRKGADGTPEIVPEEAEIIRRIFNEYLLGRTLSAIAQGLTDDRILTATGKEKWTGGGVMAILKNEKYKGDALLQKTFVTDCISKKVKKNDGELPMYYVENNHPPIIERSIFDKVQCEIARRNSKQKVREKATKTELGKYSGKYALSELVYCGECGKPYRRVTWNIRGKRKIVWRCVSRLDYGKTYCKHSPSIEEQALQNAIAEAITKKAQSESPVVENLISHIEQYRRLHNTETVENKRQRLKELQERLDKLMETDVTETDDDDFNEKSENLINEIHQLEDELEEIQKKKSDTDASQNPYEEITLAVQGLKNRPVEYKDEVIRQLVQYIKILSKNQLQITFKDGTTMTTDI